MHDVPRSTDRRLAATSRAYVVYDKTTGGVLHIHHSVTFLHNKYGAEAAEERARRLIGVEESTAGVLEVDPVEVDHDDTIEVDLTNLKVVRCQTKPYL
jgi:hypothetical protein